MPDDPLAQSAGTANSSSDPERNPLPSAAAGKRSGQPATQSVEPATSPAASPDGKPPSPPAPKRSKRLEILTPIVLGAFGLLIAVAGISLYPTVATVLPAPGNSQLQIATASAYRISATQSFSAPLRKQR